MMMVEKTTIADPGAQWITIYQKTAAIGHANAELGDFSYQHGCVNLSMLRIFEKQTIF